MKQWDIFISHASEDKELAALPLAEALRRLGVRVWLDKFQLTLGDSIREKVDEGLSTSRYGVVILSRHFFAKKWPKAELDAIFAQDVVLPVWHDITAAEVLSFSPLLAGKLAAKTADGIPNVAAQIADKLFSVRGLPELSRKVAPDFAKLLVRAPSSEILQFLMEDRTLLAKTFALEGKDLLRGSVPLGGTTVDICVAKFQPTAGTYADWRLSFLGDVTDPVLSANRSWSPHVHELLSRERTLRTWVQAHLQEARAMLPGIKGSFGLTIIVGRRPEANSFDTSTLAELNDFLSNVTVRTYDWLLDCALKTAP